jgi:NADPH dehydrogenase (quinone)
MKKNVFIVNGHQYWEAAKGELNRTLVELAKEKLTAKGYAVQTTHIDDPFDVTEEVEKILWADFIIFQTPVYWMSIPWGFKKYIDEVYMGGYGRLFDADGRSSTDPSRKYGSGGLMGEKKYMLSTTWNGPLEAFGEADQFFDGKDVDGVFFSFHKSQQFIGLKQLPTFSCHDVMKNPDVDAYLQKYVKHLDAVL